jgi:hypothetical protein
MKSPPVLALSLLALAAWLAAAAAPVAAQDGLDCEDFASQAEAQAYYRENPDDPTGNDEDGDGVACELFEYEDDATDFDPVTTAAGGDETTTTTTTTTSTGATTSTGTTTTAVPATGIGSAVAESADRTGTLTLVGLLGAALACAGLAVREASGVRR